MKRYDICDLSFPRAYEVDNELATLARRVAAKKFQSEAAGRMSRGEFKAAVLTGKYPLLVKEAVDAELATAIAHAQTTESARATIGALQTPGYALSIEGDLIVVSGPFNDDLHVRIKRAGGRWDGAAGNNRRVWLVPAAKAASLKRIFGNSSKAVDFAHQAEDAKRCKVLAELTRWLGYVEEKAPSGYTRCSTTSTMDSQEHKSKAIPQCCAACWQISVPTVSLSTR